MRADTIGFYVETVFEGVGKPEMQHPFKILFADDSSDALKQITQTLDRMSVKHHEVINGAEAWETLEKLATQCEQEGCDIKSEIQAVLTDIEIPEMDDYVLTQKIKADKRLAHLPVIMYSSLAALANLAMGWGVGSDAYVSIFQPLELAAT